MNHGSSLLILGLMASLPPASAWSQDGADQEPVRCVSVSRIDRTEVLDEYSIAFHLKGGDIYLNRLSRACSGLDDDKALSYRTSSGQLCSIDTITVLDNFGVGFTRGATCTLGVFVPTDEESLAMMKGDESADDPIVTVTEIEVTE